MEHTIPSFELLNKTGSSTIKGVKQFISGTSDISIAEGIKFNYPKGFTLSLIHISVIGGYTYVRYRRIHWL